MEVSMAEKVLMPKAGITVEECIITEWLKQKGDTVAIGDILFSYETDKATFECESTAAGEILEILFADGDEVPVLEGVCIIGQAGEDIEALKGEMTSAEVEVAQVVEDVAETKGVEAEVKREAAVTTATTNGKGEKISPRAKMTAAALEVDPSQATPTGPAGRIIERDVREFAENRTGDGFGGMSTDSEAVAAASIARVADGPEYEDVKFSGIKKATAKAMVKSLSTMAQLTHHNSFDATTIQRLRKQLKQNGEALQMPNITLNDMVLFAVSRVLKNHPDLNANMVEDNVIRQFKHVHLGMAVDTPQGLLVPVIRYANQMSLEEISTEAKRVAKLCQDGKAGPDLLAGGTFTVSNLGAMGVEMFTPVINPPQTAILGVCGISTRVKEENGELKGYPAMGLSLTYDHRAVNGSPAARFAKELGMALENLDLMLMK